VDNDCPARITDLTVYVRPGDDQTIVQVSGETDLHSEASVQDLLLRIMRTHSPRLLRDLSGVSFIDCTGLTALLITRRPLSRSVVPAEISSGY
jgi:anti-anti-sigma factor